MSNPTTPFGWQMPTATDLVTDLPADFGVFGQAVATSMADLLGGTTGQILSKTSATDMDFTWTTPNPGDITGVSAGVGISGGGTSGDVTVTNSMATAITTSGDLIQGTGSGTFARLGVGTNGQMLSSNGTSALWAAVPTVVASQTGNSGKYLTTDGTNTSWATVSAGSSWSLLNAGGTALSAATTTISGISGKDKIMILYKTASSTSACSFGFRFNGDTAGNYRNYGWGNYLAASYNTANLISDSGLTGSGSTFAETSYFASAASLANGYLMMTGCNSSGLKVYHGVSGSGGGSTGTTGTRSGSFGGWYDSTSTISSISVTVDAGTFDNGTIYVYTSA